MKYQVKYDGITKTYAALMRTARHLLDLAENDTLGSLLNLQACVVFLAFTFEAYLNHVGSEEFDIWKWIERTPQEKKLRLILHHFGLAPADFTLPTWDMIQQVTRIRDALAHGRTREINHTEEMDEEPDRRAMWNFHEWEKLSVDQVRSFKEAIKTGIERINASRRRPDKYVWNQGARGLRIRRQ